MAVSIEDVLMAKAMQDRQEKVDPAVAMSVGATGGALLGAGVGAVPHSIGMLGNKMLGRQPNRLKPGARMAGGLVGLILGGGLGEGMRRSMVTSSPAGAMLAKLQANGGQLSEADQLQLQQVLADIYGG